MDKQQQQPAPHGNTLPSALADIVQFLKRKRAAREARQATGAPAINPDKQP